MPELTKTKIQDPSLEFYMSAVLNNGITQGTCCLEDSESVMGLMPGQNTTYFLQENDMKTQNSLKNPNVQR